MATDLEAFVSGYITCALWSSTDNAIEPGGPSHPDSNGGWPLDDNYGPDDIDAATLATMRKDCAAFVELAGADLNAAYEAAPRRMDYEGAGHDFWLTRNGHGAGFWDRGLGELGERLTKHAKTFGSYDLSVGDDRKIYGG